MTGRDQAVLVGDPSGELVDRSPRELAVLDDHGILPRQGAFEVPADARRAVALEQLAIDERHHPGQAFADGAPNEKVARAQLGVDQVARSAEQGDLGVEP